MLVQRHAVTHGTDHGWSEVAHLEHVILHHISDDAILIEVAPSALCAKRFLETNLHHHNMEH